MQRMEPGRVSAAHSSPGFNFCTVFEQFLDAVNSAELSIEEKCAASTVVLASRSMPASSKIVGKSAISVSLFTGANKHVSRDCP
jgi:hypothetical protein